MQPFCPLCLSTNITPYLTDKFRHYFFCHRCSLITVPTCEHLPSVQEKIEYDKHNNDDATDLGYRRFLNRTWQPLFEKLKQTNNLSNLTGLDFGCGEGAVLSIMAKEAGITINSYDLYYHYYPEFLEQRYDFIILTEVIEHIADAHGLIKQLKQMLKSNGVLAIMTKRVIDKQAFSRWHYKNDLTHISFYSTATFEWLAAEQNWTLEIIDKDVVFFIND